MKPGRAQGAKNRRTHVADMSLPAGERGRKRKGKGRGTKGVASQMSHGKSREGNDLRRKWDRKKRSAPQAEDQVPEQPEEQNE